MSESAYAFCARQLRERGFVFHVSAKGRLFLPAPSQAKNESQ